MNIVDILSSKIRISDHIGQFVRLKAVGNNRKVGLCPFHNEKTPSFHVNDEKMFFHCFGCGIGGNVVTFASKYHKVSNGEAVKMLATQYKIQLPTIKSSARIDKLYDIHNVITDFYHKNLRKSKEAIEYLKKRGISDEVIERYKLGYSSGNVEELLEKLKAENLLQYIDDTKIIRLHNGRKVEIFHKRIIFPIMDINGRTIGWGGRSIHDTHLPKYVNSYETELFKKSNTMYGIHHALRAINTKISHKASDFGCRIIVVEGYMDVLKLASKEIYTGVAVLGTAINVEHVVKICDLAKSYPVICMDNDNAGKSAALRLAYSLIKIISKTVTAAFFSTTSEKDLDEFLHIKTSSELLAEIDKNSLSILDLVFDDICDTTQAPSKPERFAMIDSKIVEISQNILQHDFKKDCLYYLRGRLWNLKKENKNDKKPLESITTNNKTKKTLFSEAIVMDLLAFLSHNLHYLKNEKVLSVLEDLQIGDKKLQKISEAMRTYGEQYRSTYNTDEMKEVEAIFIEKREILQELNLETLLSYFELNEWKQKKEEYDKIDLSQSISDTALGTIEDFEKYAFKATFSKVTSYFKNIAKLKKRNDKF
ncbi:DNA primase [Candidatus Fokinia crypta]|uniref:DNA primase n=1 Tax=Candidatus Fokinia crypta TaxID=1920990 RepID=A0ABZ0UPA4_9RICK|nr:DNA primase [Candidatus Fokinia cryptica]WPX97961.1 DNA primase [Candidatus Fokinia cryptica]